MEAKNRSDTVLTLSLMLLIRENSTLRLCGWIRVSEVALRSFAIGKIADGIESNRRGVLTDEALSRIDYI